MIYSHFFRGIKKINSLHALQDNILEDDDMLHIAKPFIDSV